MTQLGVADTQVTHLEAGGLVSKIRWSMVVPWAVSGLLAIGPAYHRFIAAPEEARAADAIAIKTLGDKVDDQRKQIGELREEVAVLKAVVLRMEARQNSGRR